MTRPDATNIAPASGGPASARRVLVTGGAGFIGSHLVGRLLDQGHEVAIVDNLSTGRHENLLAADPNQRARFVEADLRDVLDDLPGLGPFHAVYHLAAAVGVELVMQQPVEAIETNVDLTLRLLRTITNSVADGQTPPSVLIASSSEVYGRPTRRVFSEDDDVVYGPTTVTRWSYGYAKALDEHIGLDFASRLGMRVVCARLFNTVGPRQTGRYGMVVPRFVSSAIAGRPLTVYGDGSQTRCFCDVRDVSQTLVDLMQDPRPVGVVVNVGGDEPITILDLARRVVDRLGSASEISCVPYDRVFWRRLRRPRPPPAGPDPAAEHDRVQTEVHARSDDPGCGRRYRIRTPNREPDRESSD